MNFKFKFIFILFFCICSNGFSQVKPTEKDTAKMYRNIEKYSKKRGFTKLLHKLIFEPTEKKKANPIREPKKRVYKNYEGRIVRNIEIQTLDPFGFSISDTTRKARNWTERTGNRIHIKTNRLAIKNLLLIKRNRPLDSLLVKESERLVRSQRYVREVVITAEPVSKNSDSVDVFIRVLDSWSIIPKISASTSRTNIEITERNFLGSGHEFSNRFINRNEDGKNAYRMIYIVPNIMNTFIRTTVSYEQDLDNNYGKILGLERPFYSPFARWAGGVYFDQVFRKDTLQSPEGNYAIQNFKYDSQDFWGGHSFRIFKGNTEDDRTSNLITSARYLNVNYKQRPTIAYDSINFYSDEKFYLGGIGISSRQFVEDEYLFNYGIIEDVPVGKIYGITGGYQIKNGVGRMYGGARASYGNYFKWGYLSTNFEYGTFFRDSKPEQTAFSFQANYFTNLIQLGDRWKMRQFIKPQLIIGTNRLQSTGDYLTINENSHFQSNFGAGNIGRNGSGIPGFNSAVYGTKKAVLALQTQFYSPWDLWGFRLNPYFNFTAAMLGSDEIGLTQSKLYSSVGVGLIISNDFLVFNSFQFSLSYYPSIPGQGTNIINTNSIQSEDFGFQDFEFGKPRTIIYK
ncbi:hypothetical protein J2X31_002608 [Flavobacterium arsenatis]|uniref:POTRA domain-containing protein n=1 Tax=Flavobacterium arsenatis TaxID=1484332 RepID=A0ABU1TRU9_9FLAO|nr:hypothetical protein [Flavobacterium arsenatis]MDR6968585.1 hypothetical protein [Flavobacterium arsenatis]